MGTESNAFLVNKYLTQSPKCPFYDTNDFDNGIAMLEHCLLNIIEQSEDATFMLLRSDFNARAATLLC